MLVSQIRLQHRHIHLIIGTDAVPGIGARIRNIGKRGLCLLPVFAKLLQAALDDSPAPHVVQPRDGSALYSAGHGLYSADAVSGAGLYVLLVDADNFGVRVDCRMLFLCCAVSDSDGDILRARPAI